MPAVRRVVRTCVHVLCGLVILLIAGGVAMIHRDIPGDELVSRYGGAPSRFMELEGMRVHYRDEGAGPPILLLHGTSSSLHTWDAWTRLLSGHRRVVRFDLPGFGLTGPALDGDYRVARYVRVAAGFLDRLNIARVDVAGNSLGGRIAATFALEYPHRVRKLVLLDAAGLSGVPLPTIFRLAQLPLADRLLLYLTPRFLIRHSLEEVYGDPSRVTDALIDRVHAMTLRAGNREALVRRLNEPADPALDDRLGELRMPVLIQWGEKDSWIPVENAHRFQRGISHAQLRVYPGVGHVPMEELPDPTAQDADAFLSAD